MINDARLDSDKEPSVVKGPVPFIDILRVSD